MKAAGLRGLLPVARLKETCAFSMGANRLTKILGWFLFFGWALVLIVPTSTRAYHLKEEVREQKSMRSMLDGRGITLETTNTTDILANVVGEGSTKSAIPGDIDLLLTLDGEELAGWNDATFFVYGLGLYGGNTAIVQEAQGISNISGNNTWRLFEGWYQQNLFQERLSFLVGLYEVTSEFDVTRAGSELFVNSSFGTNPTFALSGKNGPSTFPATASLAFRAQLKLTEDLTLRTVVADGVPGDPNDPDGTQVRLRSEDGVLVTTEAAYYVGKPDAAQEPSGVLAISPRRLVLRRLGRAAALEYDAKFAIGGWFYTTDLDDLSDRDGAGNPVERDGTHGLYAVAEQVVYHEKGEEQGLTLFAQAAYADPKVNRFSHYFGGGMVYRGLIPGREMDDTGFAFAIARNGDHYKDGQRREGQRVNDQEVELEWTHAIHVSPELTVQPDVQYIINPNTDPTRDDALVLGVRLELTLNWIR